MAWDPWLHGIAEWLAETPLSLALQEQSQWVFATLETLHLLGMIALIGTIGVFDLRMLGLAPSIPPRALHRLIPIGVAGFLVNAVTGSLFVVAHPHQYAFDPAFQLKLALMAVAGINLVAFSLAYGDAGRTPAGAVAPMGSRVMTGVSLVAWSGVIVCSALVSSGFFGF
jgi:hypothetical protein